MEQILFNLLSNATKYTMEGRISLHVIQNKQAEICFQVIDTGRGMTEKVVKNLFTIYSEKQLELVSKYRPKHGKNVTGLGLTVSNLICKKMESQIQVQSALGKGSKFWFCISTHPPVMEEEESKTEQQIPLEKTEATHCPVFRVSGKKAHDYKHVTILVVDDNKLNRQVAIGMIAKYKFETHCAENGLQAIQKTKELQEKFPNNTLIIFMDVEMPLMDGIEATTGIRRANNLPRPFIVALTAFASESERQKCLKSGMDHFLCKPLTHHALNEIFTNLYLI